MAGAAAKAQFEDWRSNAKKTAHIKLESVKEADNQLSLRIGDDSIPFVFNYPSTFPDLGDDTLTVFSDDDRLNDWNNSMMEFCERRRTLDEVFTEAAEYYLKFPEKKSSKSSSSSSSSSSSKSSSSKSSSSKSSSSKSSSSKSKSREEEEDLDDFDEPNFFAQDEEPPKPKKKENTLKVEDFFTGSGSKGASERLIKDLSSIMADEKPKYGFSASPIQDDLYHWEVRFFDFEKGSGLEKDMIEMKKKKGVEHIILDVRFPSDYPFSPPFVRVVRPRFQFRTGHVTVGGSICMEMLTKSGWIPCNDIESILISIRSEMIQGGGRLDFNNMSDYSEEEAKATFKRVAQQHGWEK
eukprot:TRINITY_DN1248_c0_g1_i1.p1 TRINITY_DN1248_c0_g1~~TRINITY_DN1248_c0_g1_i1.p1  ORF type:complete len:352 (+),score=96.87 TRINITY_DN1248_c0_g1_i1:57-1112(+)